MPRRRSGQRGRVPRRNANRPVAPRFSDFDENWLTQYSERQWSRLIDLTQLEDRRRWHPSSMPDAGPAPRTLRGKPRIVIVPEGHRLARFAPYGGRVPLHKVLSQHDKRTRRRFLDDWVEKRYSDKYGAAYDAFRPGHLSRRVGFQHPWQVMICVRRKRRREVIFAMGKGGSGVGRRRPQRNEFSEVRC